VSMPLHTHKNRSQSTGKALLMLYRYVITVTEHFLGGAIIPVDCWTFERKYAFIIFLLIIKKKI
jgi:hypothetical protein